VSDVSELVRDASATVGLVKPSCSISALCVLIFAVGNGCLSKSVVTQPQMTVDVVDDHGKPLESAEVRYYRWSNPHHRLDGEADLATDPSGQAAFARTETTEKVFPLCMHGVPEHHISVCVKKKGHRTVVFELESPSSATAVSVALHPGETVECDFEKLRFPSGKERTDIRATNVSGPVELEPTPKGGASASATPPTSASRAAAPSARWATGPALSVTEARKMLRTSTVTVWGYVSKIYTCPPCPPGAMCKPCMGDNIVLSEQDKKLDSYTLTGSDLVVFTKDPEALKLGARVVLEVRRPSESAGGKDTGEAHLVRIVSQ